MKKAKGNDRSVIVEILVNASRDNKNVNYIIQQDEKKGLSLQRFMGYSHDVCKLFGDVFISDDKSGCASIVKLDLRKTSFKSILSLWLVV